jgi:hypothetical protein
LVKEIVVVKNATAYTWAGSIIWWVTGPDLKNFLHTKDLLQKNQSLLSTTSLAK